MKRLSTREVWLCIIVFLLWIACGVGDALLEDTGYGTIPYTAGFVLLSCYLFYCIRNKFPTAMNAQSGMEWTSVTVILNNVNVLSWIFYIPLYCILHNKEEDFRTDFIFLLVITLILMYFVLMADLALLRKWKSAIFHIRCLLTWAIIFDATFICLEVMDDDIKVAWLHWVDVIIWSAILIVYIVGLIKTFGAKAKQSFLVEERGKRWYETVTSLVLMVLVVGTFVVLIGIVGLLKFIEKEGEDWSSASLGRVALYAELGNTEAQSELGLRYFVGVEQDYEEAIDWFTIAAENGDANAQNMLGMCYCNGYGVVYDYEEAVKWYKKAADQGLVVAQFNLGWCYETGVGVEANIDEAKEWYKKAAEQGDEDAKEALELLKGEMKGK